MAYEPGGAGDPPWPRCSYRSSRNRRPSASSCGSHSSMVVPSELPSTRTGAPGGPLILADSSTGAARPSRWGSPLTPGSDIEEDRLLISLQVNVEAQLA